MGVFSKIGRVIAVLMPEGLVAKLHPDKPTYRGEMIEPKAYAVGRLVEVMRPPGGVPEVEEGRKMLRDVGKKFDLRVPVSLTKVIPQEAEALRGIADWLKSRK